MAEPTKRARRASAAAMPPPPPRPATSARAGGGAPAWSKADWERWSRAPRMATLEVGEGCALLLMKAPLGERYEDRYGGEACVHTPHMVVERLLAKKRRLALVVDATLRSSYLHDARDWDDWDVTHVKLGARRGPADRLVDAAPTREEVDEAVAALAEAWKRPSVAAVYSLDGCNTPGLVAVAALVELRGAPVNAAFNAVAEHRPLFRPKHVAWLKARYPALAAAPAPRPAWLGGGDDGDDASDGEEPLAAAPPLAAAADADAPKPKRARLQPAATRAHRLFVVGPDGKRSLLATFDASLALCPADLESTPEGYDKDLAKVEAYPSFDATLTSDAAKLAEFCKYLVARKKAAVVSKAPRVYLPPQAPTAAGGIVLRYRT